MNATRLPTDIVSAATFFVALVLALQQIDADSLWWDLARGRSVVAGNLSPAATLLAGDEQAEADWLGGLPWFILYAALGPHGLMVARCCSVFGLLLFLRRMMPDRPIRLRGTIVVVAFLLAASPAVDPTGCWWDVGLGSLLLAPGIPRATASSQSAPETWWTRNQIFVTRFCLTVLWANVSPRSLLAVAGCRSAGSLLATLAGLCLSPRGFFGLTDSLQILMPPLSIMVGEGASPTWLSGYPIAAAAPTIPQYAAWGVLSLMAAGQLRQGYTPAPTLRRGLGWCIPQLLILGNPASLSAVAPWLGFLAIGTATDAGGRPSGCSEPVTPASARQRAVGFLGLQESTRRYLTAGGLLGLGYLLASGPWGFSSGRLGWGLSPRLEVRQLASVLATRPQPGTVFAFDTRAAGMAAWVLDGPAPPDRPEQRRLRPWLTPQRALLNGRFAAEAQLAADLRVGWEMQHTDADGSSGGWWQPLLNRHTQLLLVPAEDDASLRHLEPTLYKPLLIDAPVLPYALSGDPQLSPAIVRTLADRELVEWGRWTLGSLRPSHTDQTIDLWGILSGRPDPRPLVRQARVFLAFDLPRAALKILQPLSQSGLTDTQRERIRATLQIAEFERLRLGRPTLFRAAVLARLGGRPAVDSELSDALKKHSPAALKPWPQSAAVYLEAGPVAAVGSLPGQTPETAWTAGMLWIEAGQPEQARAVLSSILEQPDTPMENQVRKILERLPQPRSPR